jgi:hypothetical protein
MVLVLPINDSIRLHISKKEQTLLNINGRKLGNGPFKTIWSYNPDYSDSNTKVRHVSNSYFFQHL